MKSNEPLQQLLSNIALHDRKAFNMLYQTVSRKLFAIALRLTRDRKLSEEVLQDSFTKIWHKADTFNPSKAQPMTWLGTIVRNTAIDKMRQSRKSQLSEPFEEETSGPKETNTPETLIIDSDTSKTIHLCLDSIRSEWRDAITMTYLDGYSNQQLANKLDVPLGTLKSWIRRGLMEIKSCVQKKQGAESDA